MACANTFFRGAVGMTKAALAKAGIGEASVEVVLKRRDICRECPFATRRAALARRPSKGMTSISVCLKCNCYIAAKTLIEAEKCPLNKW